jgi:hypothetical protein
VRPPRRSTLKRAPVQADAVGVKRSAILLAVLFGLLCTLPASAAAAGPGCSNGTHRLCAGLLTLGLAEGEGGEEATEAEAAEGEGATAAEGEEAEAEEAEADEETEEEAAAGAGGHPRKDSDRGPHRHGAKGRRNSKRDGQKPGTRGHRKPKSGSHHHGRHKGRASSLSGKR